MFCIGAGIYFVASEGKPELQQYSKTLQFSDILFNESTECCGALAIRVFPT